MRIGAVAGQHDDQRLGRRRVRLDVDLAGRDVDEVAGRRLEGRARGRSARTCTTPTRTGCRSRSRSRRGDGSGSGRRARSRRSTNRAASDPTVGCEIAIERSMPGMLADRRAPVGRGDADGHGPMIRAGTIGRVPTWTPDPDRFPRFAAARRAVAARAAAAPLGRARRPGRGLDQARGPAAARVRWQQAAQPRVPGRRGAGRGCRLPRHVGPPLVEPRPADRRGRGAGRAGRPPRPVRPADRPAQPGRPARRAARRDRPPGRDRRPRRARRRWSPGSSRISARPGDGPRVIEVGGPGVVGAIGQVAGRARARRPARGPRPRRRRPGRPVGDRRHPGRPARRGPDGRRRDHASTASRSRPPNELRPKIEAMLVAALGAVDGLAAVAAGPDPARRRPARRGLRPADRRGRRGDPPARPDRGDPGRPDLHRQGPGRAHRARPRRASSTADGSSSGTPAGPPGLFEPLDG